ncbi:hypothetical protein NPA31_006230 [Aurantimonas sp. MSK8Z-1]|uniref:lysozyme inhibitor LprI family protein n=1 Tax=Mangrovibrevibacter kandeliae TaxID=2968473 RepID=UPI00211915EE|nr:hypothetical protein [Aurantimonas sp. MSK8Z-1]MCW4114557.1 hypothetical protein [Aurantimonas sp. MSK8Z-1]
MLRFLALMMLVLPAGAAGAASFDCARASTADETAICADPLLSDLDSLLGRSYAEAKIGGFDDVRTLARDFLADRTACRGRRACLISTYLAVLDQLHDRGASQPVPRRLTADLIAAGAAPDTGQLPQTVGACVSTRVDAVHPRLGDGGPIRDSDYDSGTGIEFANGGYQVSYAREKALITSRPGDPVTMCLVAIPHRCPPGDDRGRFYTVTNQRTHATWTLADSQHLCGGA